MAYGTTYITTQGAILAAKTLQSKTLQFSRFAVGSGTIANSSVDNIKSVVNLLNPILNFDITKISRDTDTQVTVKGLFQNTDAEEGFYLRELGLYAIDLDSNEEILFAYVNYGEEAEYINNSISEKKEHYYDMIITVGNADNVNITVDKNTVYVTEKDLDDMLANGITTDLNGNADTATKLKTARTISLIGAVSGSASFDGSDNITINTLSDNLAVLTNSTYILSSANSGNFHLNYPTGFNVHNCIILSHMYAFSNTVPDEATTYIDEIYSKQIKLNIELKSTNIEINFDTSNVNENKWFKIALVLFKRSF